VLSKWMRPTELERRMIRKKRGVAVEGSRAGSETAVIYWDLVGVKRAERYTYTKNWRRSTSRTAQSCSSSASDPPEDFPGARGCR
jgi:hypothetical protein